MRLAIDHHYSPQIAARLRDRGLDAIAVAERGWQAEDDEPLLALCTGEDRALLTNNVADFDAIARVWLAEGRSHGGLVFSSDASLPRVKGTIGRYVDALDELMHGHPAGLADQTHWLRRSS